MKAESFLWSTSEVTQPHFCYILLVRVIKAPIQIQGEGTLRHLCRGLSKSQGKKKIMDGKDCHSHLGKQSLLNIPISKNAFFWVEKKCYNTGELNLCRMFQFNKCYMQYMLDVNLCWIYVIIYVICFNVIYICIYLTIHVYI